MKKKTLLFPVIYLTVSIIVVIYTLYKDKIFYDGHKSEYYQIYYLISLFVFFFSIFSFFLSKKNIKNLNLILLSFLFSFYLIEGFLGHKNQKKKNIEIKSAKERLLTFERYKKNFNVDLISIAPIHFMPDNLNITPLSGYSNSLNFSCPYDEKIFLKHDQYGFNNPDSAWENEVINYLLLGNSASYAPCAEQDKNIAGYLRIFTNKNVINLGQLGNGPLIEFATLKEYLVKQKTKNIIWIYYEGDMQRLDSEKEFDLLKKYLNISSFSQKLIDKQNYIDEIILKKFGIEYNQILNSNAYHFNIKKFIKLYYQRQFLLSLFPKKKEYDTELLKIIFLKTKDIAEKNKSKLFFVYLPTVYNYLNEKKDFSEYEKVLKIFSETNVTAIDLHEELFSKIENISEYFNENDGYNSFNEKGNQLIANIILNKIKD